MNKNRFEQSGSESTPENIGEFSLGSKEGEIRRPVDEGGEELEKEILDITTLKDNLHEKHCDQLVSFLSDLSPSLIKKIDGGLNIEGHGIADLQWAAEPDRQNEIKGILNEIIDAQDSTAVNNACKRLSYLIG